ncbi:MAG: large conductance mechanosensitive channel protein MscL [Dehalococcoidia bacterium]|jgi:large conductance mechanosensitive channel|uniref:large conductance mechanosensitive channel protein MscL n=1 Tax=Candidatus Amarobacter glycogenicus TaxID=3140699 RepID=UPI001DBA98F5|nr:large conductance mechanosensitive channel protein MscL [Dehalococcoidia bacterium]MBK6562932.1 large conductance mechanosensitive channel protein MscL [Dehalococcoidia bacterium]MBK7126577.1 large conductance mechanosensitive channel protein MscL [Dehalococcoidia bacterium]MBK7329296.1 large conductance mechanosensitive channel protein MscL [Dehalococcoidia bacterium]MBK7725222.1 large conductance mechanosensitive channel protein MscL [Dehalococcoidia bacterium]
MNQGIIKEFRDFLLRGDLISLAVAFIMAGAFGAVVAVFTDGIIMAFIAAIFGKPSFDSIGLDIGDGRLAIGSFLTAVVNLVIVAAAVFFFIVKPVQAIKDRQKKEGEVVPDADDIALLKEIRDLLKNRP